MKKYILAILVLPMQLLCEELALEDDFSKKGEMSFGAGFDYIHSKSDGITNTNYVLKTSAGDFVEVPISSNTTSLSDIVSSTISGRYGIFSDMTAFGYIQSHYSLFKQNQKETESKQFDNLSLGLSYKLKKEDETPAIFTKLSTKVIDRVLFENSYYNQYFTTANITFGTYKSIDPVTLMLETSYIYNKNLKHNAISKKQGNVFILSPTMYFAINPYITVNLGVDYRHFAKDKLNSTTLLDSYNQISKSYGVSYELGKSKVISFDYENSDDQDSISFNFNYTL